MGEWFTGAIVIIYYLFPIIVHIFNRNKILIPIFLFFGFVIMTKTTFFEISKCRNLISCISSFYFGIIFIKYKKLFLNSKVIFTAFCIIYISYTRIYFSYYINLSWKNYNEQ